MSRGSKDRRTDTRDPRRSRARALKLLYQADVRGQDPVALLDRVVADPRAAALLDDLDPDQVAELGEATPADHADADPEHPRVAAAVTRNLAPIDGFTRSLVAGVADRRDELDQLVQGFARRWAVSRMPAVDRNALRLGAYELAHETTSPAVVINEIVELAKGLSTDDSGRYVNGVLESIRKRLAADREATADASTEDSTEGTAEGTAEEPVALAGDVELVEVATPEPEDADAPVEVDVSDQVEASDQIDEEEGPGEADGADDPDDPDDPDEPEDEDPSGTFEELRHEHPHGTAGGGAAGDAAQQQLF